MSGQHITRGVFALFLLTLPLSLLLMGLTRTQEETKKTLLHLHREDGKAFQHLEFISPDDHSVVRFDIFGSASNWPRFLHSPPKDLGPTQKTSSKLDETLGGLFLYDNWEQRSQLSSPAMDAPDVERQLVFLLDRSGTMKREGGRDDLNALARVYERATSQRKADPRPWQCFSFSSQLEEHGTWTPNSPPPAGLFSESRGTTALIQALSQLQPKLKVPTDIVIISDGETDTRDQDSLERSIEEFSKKGHQLALLSPDFSPVENWKNAYASGLITDQWPEEMKAKKTDDLFEHSPSSTRWGERRNVRLDQHHVVLLRDKQGRALLSFESGKTPLSFHVIGKLLSEPADLKSWLLKRFGTRPALLLDGTNIHVNLGIDSLQPLTVWGEFSQKIYPHVSGRYTFLQPRSGHLELFHPDTGPFRLEGLEIWPHEKKTVVRDWKWDFLKLSSPLPPLLEPWFKSLILVQIFLLLFLWHLRRPRPKT
jgi:hypothetical protein